MLVDVDKVQKSICMHTEAAHAPSAVGCSNESRSHIASSLCPKQAYPWPVSSASTPGCFPASGHHDWQLSFCLQVWFRNLHVGSSLCVLYFSGMIHHIADKGSIYRCPAGRGSERGPLGRTHVEGGVHGRCSRRWREQPG